MSPGRPAPRSIGRTWIGTGAFAAALLGLAGCETGRPPPASPAPAPAGHAALTLDTPVQTIVATPGGKAVLDKDLPGLTTRPEYAMFKAMSLNALASLSNGKLNKAKLAQVQTDLAKLPTGAASHAP